MEYYSYLIKYHADRTVHEKLSKVKEYYNSLNSTIHYDRGLSTLVPELQIYLLFIESQSA